jgi:hypothetical protein
MRWVSLFLAGLLSAQAAAADLSALDRSIRKEPAYAGKPRYCLLVFGPAARERVWLIQDGDTLYVDRNGNGDLAEAGKRVPAAKDAGPKENGYTFEAGDLSVGGKVHKGLTVSLTPLKQYADNPDLADVAAIHDALKADSAVIVARMSLDVASARFKGAGIGDRITQLTGLNDLSGVLTFAEKPVDAPVIHFDGPLTITFYGEVPKLRLGRDTDLILTVGTPGRGSGTFAMLAYQDVVPKNVHPKVEIRWPGDPPAKQMFELKQRC